MKLFILFCQPEDTKLVPQALAVLDEYSALHTHGSVETAKTQLEAGYLASEYLRETDNYGWFEVDLGPVEKTIQAKLIPQVPSITGELVNVEPASVRNPSITVQVGRTPGKVFDDEIIE